jgi:hypothetical protein
VYRANFDGGVAAAVKRLGGGAQNCEKEFEVIAYSNLYLYRKLSGLLKKY